MICTESILRNLVRNGRGQHTPGLTTYVHTKDLHCGLFINLLSLTDSNTFNTYPKPKNANEMKWIVYGGYMALHSLNIVH